MKMVERVELAICCPNGCQKDNGRDDIRGSVSICQAHTFRKEALAALKAMREPSDEMFGGQYGGALRSTFTAMIDAAIKEAEGE